MKEIKFKLFILAMAVLLVGSTTWFSWQNYQSGVRDGKITQEKSLPEIDPEMIFPRLIMSIPPTDETIILSYKKAIELAQKFPVIGYTFPLRDLPWPISQSVSIERFIEWLYLNDYEIVKKEAK